MEPELDTREEQGGGAGCGGGAPGLGRAGTVQVVQCKQGQAISIEHFLEGLGLGV